MAMTLEMSFLRPFQYWSIKAFLVTVVVSLSKPNNLGSLRLFKKEAEKVQNDAINTHLRLY